MYITGKEFDDRYGVSHSTRYNRINDGTIPEHAIKRGKGGSDGVLFDIEVCDGLALEGKLGNKALKHITKIKGEEHEKAQS
ncbi:hypothetical protein [Sulfurovum mangrovi]|uniref:hypothetical protein n=1 Tax=Sulfurovum mangrovi TaxID=2893889 RepID=UPI001E52C808|nr:hypothetical protein [Sulfurovum mangrovi]UFH59814.1 hypothetical protein LN246_02975 [Sulfurovum mangrovi]UFH59865.1 hypothetical protein LN246_03235 [Sulfurovum mangrovi]UFH60611.1 hypothetical protein LN246_13620 [Sulfurovum mangrovi]